jgi:pSer/pThr/pTyr-binding forkhead associated (FHA) protein
MEKAQTDMPSCASLVRQTAASLVINRQIIPLTKKITKLGRHMDNDIVIHEEFLSRYHAEIVLEEANFVLYDKNSTGGTYVNGRKIDRCLLNSGDLISLVNVQIMFVNSNSSLLSKSMGLTQGLEGSRNDR